MSVRRGQALASPHRKGSDMDNKIWSAAALAVACAFATPARANELPSAAADRQLTAAFMGWMDKVFAVPAAPDIDPALRDAVAAMSRQHLERLRTLIPAWIAEERARAGSASTDMAIIRPLHNRLVNELALWRLESPGAEYDAILMRAIQSAGTCEPRARDSYLGMLMSSFEAVPPADRATFLAGERALLAHWGTPRTGLTPPPAKSLDDDAAEAIARLRSGAEPPDASMPAALASGVMSGAGTAASASLACARHQWGLARALRRGDSPAQALNAWRYASIRTAVDWAVPPPAGTPPRAVNDFPFVAERDGVAGWVNVRVSADAQGRFASAAIADRHVSVPGVRDNPPVAFATLFDGASLATAPLRFKPAQPRIDGGPASPVTMKIEWTLD